MNPHMYTAPLLVEGASDRDMAMYYSGCFALHDGELVYLSDVGATSCVIYYVKSDGGVRDDRIVDTSELERLFVPMGVYLRPNGRHYTLEYLQSRSYKRSTYPDHLQVRNARGNVNVRAAMYHAVNPINRIDDNTYRVSDRIAVVDNKIVSLHKSLTLGSIGKDGVPDTPFPCITQRIQEGVYNV